eukprot:TRINITY_DN48766_c0_g1_i1.p1 TRINITY_DN48766_c0_g1~~TRINITY_DN48766_c0_g1_i1.p1  ORF type:complete len:795 (+),score=94.61 TRINITY_DN48766_c0_g1_i1:152-2536(+)
MQTEQLSVSSHVSCRFVAIVLAFAARSFLVTATTVRRVDNRGQVSGANRVAAEEATAAVSGDAARSQREPKPAGWFGAFVEQESTYDEDALGTSHRNENPIVNVLDGWNPNVGGGGSDAAKYHESPSAAGKEAWQTHFPAVHSSKGATGAWYQGAGGSWNQEYVSFKGGSGNKKAADWFDSSVDNVDGWGRRKEPWAGAGRRFTLWEERSVNTTISCAEHGCTAGVQLNAFDGRFEQAVRCRLSFSVHPTDFDESFSGENVEWITMNNKILGADCKPGVSGCDSQPAHVLYPCITDLDVSDVVSLSGTQTFAAKIPDVVDECPYEGNLLSGMLAITCLVAPIDVSPLRAGLPNSPSSPYNANGVPGVVPTRVVPGLGAGGYNANGVPLAGGQYGPYGDDGYSGYGPNGLGGFNANGQHEVDGPFGPLGDDGYDGYGRFGPYGPGGKYGSKTPGSRRGGYDANGHPDTNGSFGPYGNDGFGGYGRDGLLPDGYDATGHPDPNGIFGPFGDDGYGGYGQPGMGIAGNGLISGGVGGFDSNGKPDPNGPYGPGGDDGYGGYGKEGYRITIPGYGPGGPFGGGIGVGSLGPSGGGEIESASNPFGTLKGTETGYYPLSGDWSFGGVGPDGSVIVVVNPGEKDSTNGTMLNSHLFRAVAPLSCAERGCEAWVNVILNKTAVMFGTCLMSVFVNQTDFDGDGSLEVIEYIRVANTTISENLTPGINPCREASSGHVLSQDEMTYTAVNGVDVTQQAADGALEVRGKISPLVDECASNGFLFNAIVQVNCQVRAPSTSVSL